MCPLRGEASSCANSKYGLAAKAKKLCVCVWRHRQTDRACRKYLSAILYYFNFSRKHSTQICSYIVLLTTSFWWRAHAKTSICCLQHFEAVTSFPRFYQSFTFSFLFFSFLFLILFLFLFCYFSSLISQWQSGRCEIAGSKFCYQWLGLLTRSNLFIFYSHRSHVLSSTKTATIATVSCEAIDVKRSTVSDIHIGTSTAAVTVAITHFPVDYTLCCCRMSASQPTWIISVTFPVTHARVCHLCSCSPFEAIPPSFSN